MVQRAGAPVVILNLQPVPAMDYANRRTPWNAWPTPVSAPSRSWRVYSADPGSRASLVTGTVYDDPDAWARDRRLVPGGARRAKR